MTIKPIRTLVTEAALQIDNSVTLYDLRAFIDDTEDMDDAAQVFVGKIAGFDVTHSLRLVHRENA